MAARFRIDQATPGLGTVDRTRTDLVPGEVITLTVPSPVVGATYTWEILHQYGSTAGLLANAGTSVSIGPSGSIGYFCSFMVKLTETISGVSTSRKRIAAVRSQNKGLRPLLFGETANAASTRALRNADDSVDNEARTAIDGVTGDNTQNWSGYTGALNEALAAVEASSNTSSGSSDISSVRINVSGNGTLGVTSGWTDPNFKKAARIEVVASGVCLCYGMLADLSSGGMFPGKEIVNVGSGDLVLVHDSASVAGGAQNKFSLSPSEGSSYTVKPEQSVSFGGGYNYTDQLWKKPADGDSLVQGEAASAFSTKLGKRPNERRILAGSSQPLEWRAGDSTSADGGVVFGTTGSGRWRRLTDYVTPEMFGAPKDGASDDASAIRLAITYAGGKPVVLTPGTYLLNSVGSTIHNNMKFAIEMLSGTTLILQAGAKLKYANGFINLGGQAWGAGGILALSKSDVAIYGPGEIDCNGANNLLTSGQTRPCYPVRFYNCTNQICEGITIRNNPGLNGILCAGRPESLPGKRGRIAKNVLINGGTSLASNTFQTDYSGIYCDADDVEIYSNVQLHDSAPRTYAGGIELHGNRIKAHHNHLEYCFPAFYASADTLGATLDGCSISDNTTVSCQVGIQLLGTGTIGALTISNNKIRLKNWIGGFTVPSLGVETVSVYTTQSDGVVIVDNDIAGEDATVLTQPQSYGMRLVGMRNAKIERNRISNITGNAYLLACAGLEFKDVAFSGNVAENFGRNSGGFGHDAYVLAFDQAADVCERLLFKSEVAKVSAQYGTGSWKMFGDVSHASATLHVRQEGCTQAGLAGLIGGGRASEVFRRPLVGATPNVHFASECVTANGSTTAITNLLGGVDRQVVTVRLDAYTQLIAGASIVTRDGKDIAGSGITVDLENISGVWTERGYEQLALTETAAALAARVGKKDKELRLVSAGDAFEFAAGASTTAIPGMNIAVTGGRYQRRGPKTHYLEAFAKSAGYTLGTSDDTTAVQAFFNAVRDWHGQGDCVIEGSYFAKVALDASHSDFTIRGRGKNTGFKQVTGQTYCFSIMEGSAGSSDPATNLRGLKLINFGLYGNVASFYSPSVTYVPATHQHWHLLNANSLSDFLFERLYLQGAVGDAVYLGAGNVGGLERHNEHGVMYKLEINGSVGGATLGGRNGITLIDATGVTIERSLIYACSRSDQPGAIDAELDNTWDRLRDITIADNTFKSIGGSVAVVAFQIAYTQAALATKAGGFHVLRNTFYSDITNPNLIGVQQGGLTGVADATTAPLGVRIRDNRAVGAASRPYNIGGVRDLIADGNKWDSVTRMPLIGNGGAACYDVTVGENERFYYCGTIDTSGMYIGTLRKAKLWATFQGCGASNGSFGYAMDFGTGASSEIDITKFKCLPDGKTTFAIQKEAGHTFDAGTNLQRGAEFGGIYHAFRAGDRVVTLKQYNAKGDGVTDDYDALWKAISFVYDNGGGVVEIDGTYLIGTATLTLPQGVLLRGRQGTTSVLKHGFNGAMFDVGSNAGIENLTLAGQGATFTGPACTFAAGTSGQTFRHFKITDFNGYCLQFLAIDAGSQSTFVDGEMWQRGGTTGTGKYAVKIPDTQQLAATPRKFVGIEFGGYCSFDLGGCNNTYITDCFMADLRYTDESRAVQIKGGRIANMAALTFKGHNNTIVGCDVAPQVTIASGTDNCVLGPNSWNKPQIIDLSGNNRNQIHCFTLDDGDYYQPQIGGTGVLLWSANATQSGGGPVVAGQSGAGFPLRLEITTGGARGTAQFKWSVYDGATWVQKATSITIPSGGSYALQRGGATVNLTFAAGTYVLGETYTFSPVTTRGTVTRHGAVTTVSLEINIGATTTMPSSGGLSVSLPQQRYGSDLMTLGGLEIYDHTTNYHYQGWISIPGNVGACNLFAPAPSLGNGVTGVVTASSPYAIAAGDYIRATFTYTN